MTEQDYKAMYEKERESRQLSNIKLEQARHDRVNALRIVRDTYYRELSQDNAKLRAKLEQETKRLDFVLSSIILGCGFLNHKNDICTFYGVDVITLDTLKGIGKTEREAIDKAMKKGE